MTADAIEFGAGGALRFASNRGRSITSESLGAVRYPNPFFDIAHTYLPSSIKTMLRWCRYYFLTNPLINAVVYKMAAYPVTDLLYDTDNDGLRKNWKFLFENVLEFKKFQVESGLDFYTYGNTFISIHYPFHKYLRCQKCGWSDRVEKSKYVFRNMEFVGDCPRCRTYGTFKGLDHPIRSVRDIRLIRWNPENITVQHNEATGDTRYFYTIPPILANDIRLGKRQIIETIPQVFLQAMKENKALLFSKDNLYHMKRPTIAQKDKGWGMPMILPVLKDVFYLQILRKAQEAIAVEHIVPLRILSPQTASASSDVYCTALDTLVETREGVLPAAEVQVGDYLKSHTGKWKRVEAVRDRDVGVEEKVYRFKIASLSAFPFEVSEEHPVLAARKMTTRTGYSGLSEPEWMQAKELKRGDFVLYPTSRVQSGLAEIDLADYVHERAVTDRFIYRRLSKEAAEIYEYFEENGVTNFGYGGRAALLQEKGWEFKEYANAKAIFTQEDTVDRMPRHLPIDENLAYIMGLYTAEGSPKGSCAALGLHTREQGLMDRMDQAIEALGFRKSTRGTEGNCARYEINDVILSELLRNACGKGAVNKQLPRFLLEAPDPILLQAIKGVLDGDGCFIDTDATLRVNLMTVSPQLAVSIRAILLSWGFIATLQKRIPGSDEIAKLPIYQVNVNGAAGIRLALMLGWDVSAADHKGNSVSRCGFIRDGYCYLRVKDKQEVDVGVVRGFQMAEDHSFCVVGVATHNSTVNLTKWREQIEREIMRWRMDNNYIPILPIPVSQQTLGGDGRALMLAQEYRVWSEQIISGMGTPVEFVFGGLCLDFNELAITSDGIVPIGSLVPPEAGQSHDIGLAVPTTEGIQKAVAAHNVGLRRPITITTRQGNTLRGAPTHPILTLSPDLSLQYRNLQDLTAGEVAVRSVGADLWASTAAALPEGPLDRGNGPVARRTDFRYPTAMTEELARLLGYLVSEGSIDEERIRFGNSDLDVVEDFRRVFQEVFGVVPSVSQVKLLESGSPFQSVEIWSRNLVQFFKEIDFSGGCHDRRVPWPVLRSPKPVVSAFLKAYYEGDGSVCLKPDGGGSVVAYTTADRLAKELQLVLQNAGIDAFLYRPTKASPIYKVVVRSQFEQFQEFAGFLSERKRQSLQSLMGSNRDRVTVPFSKDLINALKTRHPQSSWRREPFEPSLQDRPYSVVEACEVLGHQDDTTVLDLIAEGELEARKDGKRWFILPASLAQYCREKGRAIRSSSPWPVFRGKHATLQDLRDLDLSLIRRHDEQLANMVERIRRGDLRFDRIVSIDTEPDLIPMGDLSVPGPECYVAGGIVCHNSYSGSNVSLRMLENHFLDTKQDQLRFVRNFLIPNIGSYMGWDRIDVHFRRFKMADDLQRSAFNFQLNQAGKLSDKSMLEENDWDADRESERTALERKCVLQLQKEQALGQAAIQGEAQLMLQKYQLRGQKSMMEAQQESGAMMDPQAMQDMQQQGAMMVGQPGMSPDAAGQMGLEQQAMMNQAGAIVPPAQNAQALMEQQAAGQQATQQQAGAQQGAVPSELQSPISAGQEPGAGTVFDLANRVAGHLDQMPQAEQQAELARLRQHNPQLHSLVLQVLNSRGGAHLNSNATPLPTERPPRRGPEAAII